MATAKNKTQHVHNGKPAKKAHKNSFLADAPLLRLQKELKLDGFVMIGYKQAVGTEVAVRAGGREAMLNILNAMEVTKRDVLGKMAQEAIGGLMASLTKATKKDGKTKGKK